MLVNILAQQGIPEQDVVIVYNSLCLIANILNPNLNSDIEIKNLAQWHAHDYQEGSNLMPHKSINWFIEQAFAQRVKDHSLNSSVLLSEGMAYSLKQNGQLPFVVFVVDFDIIHPKVGFSLGLTTKLWSSVISVHSFRNQPQDIRSKLIQTLALHEGGHLFGLVNEDRRFYAKDQIGLHCIISPCVMRQGWNVDEWIKMSQELRPEEPFCLQCKRELLYNAVELRKSRE